nr:hypothetical protein [Desulfosporosinus sp. HMP52]
MIHPIDNTVMVFTLGKDEQYGKPHIFIEGSQLKSSVFTDLTIDFKQLFGL